METQQSILGKRKAENVDFSTSEYIEKRGGGAPNVECLKRQTRSFQSTHGIIEEAFKECKRK